jgi:hypothetical protein
MGTRAEVGESECLAFPFRKCHTTIDRSLPCFPPPEAFPSLLRLLPPSKRGCRQKRHLFKKRKSFWVALAITSRLVSLVRFFLALFALHSPLCHPIGLPNVGKSSFFNVLSQTGKHLFFFVLRHCTTCPSIDSSFLDLGKSANFPYATIDPEAGYFVRHLIPPLKSIH